MTRIADDVLGRLAQLQNDVFQRVCEGSLSEEKVFRLHNRLLGNLLVQLKSNIFGWEGALKEGCCVNKRISPEFTEEDLPWFSREDKYDPEINLRQQAEYTTSQAWLEILDKSNAKFAHPLKVLAIGYDENTKAELREGAIFTIWVSPRTDQLWNLVLKDGETRVDPNCSTDDTDDEGWPAWFRAAVDAKK
jgi:hypothetical protein